MQKRKSNYFHNIQRYKYQFSKNRVKIIHKKYRGCIITNCTFKNMTIENVDFIGTNLKKNSFKNTKFVNCFFLNCNFEQSNFSNASFINVYFCACKLSNCKNLRIPQNYILNKPYNTNISNYDLLYTIKQIAVAKNCEEYRVISVSNNKINLWTLGILLDLYDECLLNSFLSKAVKSNIYPFVTLYDYINAIDNYNRKCYHNRCPASERISGNAMINHGDKY